MPFVTLHSLLRYSHFRRSGCRILWDVRSDPHHGSVRHYRSYQPLSYARLAEFATRPPVYSMTIKCNVFPFPASWRIYVANPRGVCVLDVLLAIAHALRTPVTRAEWQRLSRKQREGVGAAFNQRWSHSPDAYYERSRGVRRIDCLQRHTRFAGLSRSWDAPYMWTMTLARQR
ncbi:hypothetical protein GLOTRDRAFT_47572 [Gloeophyllum trabeum ATCC 11539]|uniref:DUF6699 domain-containing protein n=1 Tax=Gloeophyllum trabeum (strain ATCC 11539 / FP-39264 / Madison 617) TaxID=670483 RepID=S7PYB5_GLOTA|nr:uncharacterized protein GLOTRDRAFT_47572 [Gloeophyllum trabeum ATCC 11539]EPQ52342.1 hypothetical protein GLOTRDRAFT_47572 [Gloeophyllum trabeum ATCC 11539]